MQKSNRLVWLLMLAALLALAYWPLGARVKYALRDTVLPLEDALTALRRRVGGVDRAAPADENRRLGEEVARLRAEVGVLRAVEERYERLRARVGFKPSLPLAFIPCEVVGRDVSGWWRSVRLNKGYQEGVQPDCAVATGEGLVGRTQHVTERGAEALLLCDPACRVSARLPRNRGFGVLRGQGLSPSGRPLCRLELVDRTDPPRTNDQVVTSGLGGVFPSGLAIGYVERVYESDEHATLSADVVPAADLARLDLVFVVAADEDPFSLMRRKALWNPEETP